MLTIIIYYITMEQPNEGAQEQDIQSNNHSNDQQLVNNFDYSSLDFNMINQQEPGEQAEEKEKEEEVYPPGSPPIQQDFIQFSETHPQEDYYHHHPPMSKACCEACKRRDKNNGKSCVCVVPANQRKVNLKEMGGCRTCGCNGCTRED